jgi:flagellar hook assembly protein FlgD
VQWDGATAVSATINLPSAAQTVAVAISDTNGKVVRTLQLGAQGAGDVNAAWDGLDDNGAPVTPGAYTLQPAAFDSNGNAVSASLSTSGLVTGVAYQGGVPLLKVGSSLVQMSNVTSINERNTP